MSEATSLRVEAMTAGYGRVQVVNDFAVTRRTPERGGWRSSGAATGPGKSDGHLGRYRSGCGSAPATRALRDTLARRT